MKVQSQAHSTFATVVGWVDIGIVALNLVLGFVRRGHFARTWVVLVILLATGIALLVHNRLGRIMAVVTGVIFGLASLVGLSLFGRGNAVFILAVIVLCVALAVVHFMARSRLKEAADEASGTVKPTTFDSMSLNLGHDRNK